MAKMHAPPSLTSRPASAYTQPTPKARAISSVGRALCSHRRGHWFESSIAHHSSFLFHENQNSNGACRRRVLRERSQGSARKRKFRPARTVWKLRSTFSCTSLILALLSSSTSSSPRSWRYSALSERLRWPAGCPSCLKRFIQCAQSYGTLKLYAPRKKAPLSRRPSLHPDFAQAEISGRGSSGGRPAPPSGCRRRWHRRRLPRSSQGRPCPALPSVARRRARKARRAE